MCRGLRVHSCLPQAANCRLGQEAGSAIQYLFIYIFCFCYATTACNLMQKTVCSLPFSIFINPCALIATVEMMGNQMAEIEDFKIDPKTGPERAANKRQLHISISNLNEPKVDWFPGIEPYTSALLIWPHIYSRFICSNSEESRWVFLVIGNPHGRPQRI